MFFIHSTDVSSLAIRSRHVVSTLTVVCWLLISVGILLDSIDDFFSVSYSLWSWINLRHCTLIKWSFKCTVHWPLMLNLNEAHFRFTKQKARNVSSVFPVHSGIWQACALCSPTGIAKCFCWTEKIVICFYNDVLLCMWWLIQYRSLFCVYYYFFSRRTALHGVSYNLFCVFAMRCVKDSACEKAVHDIRQTYLVWQWKINAWIRTCDWSLGLGFARLIS